VAAFILIRLGLHASGLDRLFHEQMPVHTVGRSLTLLAVVIPFAVVLLASLLTSAIGKASTAVAYGASWLVYASLLSQALLSMSGAFLLLLPLWLPLNALAGWLHPHKWHLPLHYTSVHEPVVVGLISVGLALIVVAVAELLRDRRHDRLATSGLYASLRHPQHLGIIVWTLGFALWGASPVDLMVWFIVSFVFVCLGIHEEGKLSERYSDAYAQYRRRVRFMPPFIPIRGALHIETGRQLGVMAAVLVLGIAAIMGLFYLCGVPTL
jgi:protein-S-isoprenylcysteine O-methyltransferase Ste14